MKRLICLAGATALLFAATATAATTVQTKVSIHTDPTFHGLVWNPGSASTADKRACRIAGRVVSVYRDKPATDELQGRTHTERSGSWALDVDAHHGDYYATVARKVLPSGVVCERARSFNIAVH